MANVNSPFGLRPVCYRNGSGYAGRATMYQIASGDTNAYAIGDPVVLSGAGSTGGIPVVTLATAGTGNQVLGAVISTGGTRYGGPLVDPASLDSTVIPATKTKNYFVLVADDPDIEFEVQEDSVGGALAVASLGINVNLISGTNNGYSSGWMADSSSVAATATLQLQLLRLSQRPDNEVGNFAKWVVRIVNHSFNAGTAGV
jgi:hypothetical protein